MKFDPVILGMTPGDVSIVMSDCIKEHLTCECVDRRDPDIWADHLGDIVTTILLSPPDPDGSWAKLADEIHTRAQVDQ